jgi:hypothetical protein
MPDAFSNSVRTLPTNYGSGTGTAGSDNTAGAVKTIVCAANTLLRQGDRMRVRAYWIGGAGLTITGTLAVNGVTVCTNNDLGATDIKVLEAWLHYVDATHANIISVPDGVISQSVSAVNVAGFNWAANQNITVSQDAVMAKHLTVYLLVGDIFPQ